MKDYLTIVVFVAILATLLVIILIQATVMHKDLVPELRQRCLDDFSLVSPNLVSQLYTSEIALLKLEFLLTSLPLTLYQIWKPFMLMM